MKLYQILLTIAISSIVLSGCGSTPVSVTRLKHIQDTEGFMSESLFYCGSTKEWHYFEQDEFKLLKPFPLSKDDGVRKFKAHRSEIQMPGTMEYNRAEYEGQDDDQRRKIRLKAKDLQTGVAAVVVRKTPGERWVEKHGPLDPARLKFRDAGDGGILVEYDD